MLDGIRIGDTRTCDVCAIMTERSQLTIYISTYNKLGEFGECFTH